MKKRVVSSFVIALVVLGLMIHSVQGQTILTKPSPQAKSRGRGCTASPKDLLDSCRLDGGSYSSCGTSFMCRSLPKKYSEEQHKASFKQQCLDRSHSYSELLVAQGTDFERIDAYCRVQ